MRRLLKCSLQTLQARRPQITGINVVRGGELHIVMKHDFRFEIENAPKKISFSMPAPRAGIEKVHVDATDRQVGIVKPRQILV
ncbi:hypothetical protein, partial [Stenotrophomonas maltophilia]|uniref:hypothetical protein n=1 Tax=Stenotrophomonas maltophilia TaxID=40324 RepID=UPI001EF8FF96